MTTPNPGSGARLAAVLSAFADRTTLSVEEIGRATGVPTSAVYRHLHTLIEAGLVAPAPTRGRYSAGPRTVQLAENYKSQILGRGTMTRRLNQLAAYLIPSGDRVLCVEAAEGPQVVRCSFSPGASQPLLRGASAQAILAFLPEDRIDELATIHGLDPRAHDGLRAELHLVRERGYALSVGVLDDGVWGVSVPILDAAGGAVGTVSTMAPEFRIRGRHERLIALTHAAAADVGRLANAPDRGADRARSR